MLILSTFFLFWHFSANAQGTPGNYFRLLEKHGRELVSTLTGIVQTIGSGNGMRSGIDAYTLRAPCAGGMGLGFDSGLIKHQFCRQSVHVQGKGRPCSMKARELQVKRKRGNVNRTPSRRTYRAYRATGLALSATTSSLSGAPRVPVTGHRLHPCSDRPHESPSRHCRGTEEQNSGAPTQPPGTDGARARRTGPDRLGPRPP